MDARALTFSQGSRQDGGPGQGKALLQGGHNLGVHLLDGAQDGQPSVEGQGGQKGDGGVPPHPHLEGPLVHPRHCGHQRRRGGRGGQPLPKVNARHNGPRRHHQVGSAAAGDGHEDDPRRPHHAEAAAKGQAEDGGQQKGHQNKGLGRDQAHPHPDEKGHRPSGPPQSGEQAQQQQHPQYLQRGGHAAPGHLQQGAGGRPPARPHREKAEKARQKGPKQGQPLHHTPEHTQQKDPKRSQQIHSFLPKK